MNYNIKNVLINSYNNNASYRNEKTEIESWKQNEMNKFLEHVNMYKEHQIDMCKLLDLGSGTGLYAQYYNKLGFDVTCIDLSPEMIKLCKEKGLKAQEMDFTNLQFNDNSFDFIWSLNTLLHVPKKTIEDVLKGVKRILKPNGIFYLGLYGGKEFEGIKEDDFYIPKRFFSFYTDQKIIEIVKKYFEIISFDIVNKNNNGRRFQSIVVKNN